jgi:hypothetical protein
MKMCVTQEKIYDRGVTTASTRVATKKGRLIGDLLFCCPRSTALWSCAASLLAAVFHPLLSLRLGCVEFRALLSRQDVPDLRLLLRAKREHPLTELGRNISETTAPCAVALLAKHSGAVGLETHCARCPGLRPDLTADALELRAILLVNRLDLRLLGARQIQILGHPAREITAMAHPVSRTRFTLTLTLILTLCAGNAGHSKEQRGPEGHETYS